jgi:hypothetical protein
MRDVFELASAPEAVPGFAARYLRPPFKRDGGTESVEVEIISQGSEIVSGGEIGRLRFQSMLAKEAESDIIISDGTFLDERGNTVCYFRNDYLSDIFLSSDLCGDKTIRRFLDGITPASIVYVKPNPVHGNTMLELVYRSNMESDDLTIDIFNILGEKVRTFSKADRRGIHKERISLQGLADGVYTLGLSSGGHSEQARFVIMR